MHRRSKIAQYEDQPERVYLHGLSGPKRAKRDGPALGAKQSCACASSRGEFAFLRVNTCVHREPGVASPILNSDHAASMMYGILPEMFTSWTEHFAAMVVDAHRKPVGVKHIGGGGFTSVTVDLAVLLQAILLIGGPGVFLFHNHPSGDLSFSDDDRLLTLRIFKTLEVLRIKLHDHIVVGVDSNGDIIGNSMHANGLLPK